MDQIFKNRVFQGCAKDCLFYINEGSGKGPCIEAGMSNSDVDCQWFTDRGVNLVVLVVLSR